MVAFTHAVYIDEAGLGAPPHFGLNRWWVSAAIIVPFQQKPVLDHGMATIRETHFRTGVKEIKAKYMPGKLRRDVTPSAVLSDLSALMKAVGAHAWVTGTHHGVNPLPGLSSTLAKDIARDLLFSRLNGFFKTGEYAPGHFLLIWDISQVQELHDFSRSISTFRSSFNQDPLSPRCAPAVLGGLSHDWPGIQIADIFAHYGLHRAALGLDDDADPQKATGFDTYVEPRLQRAFDGRVVGWKIW